MKGGEERRPLQKEKYMKGMGIREGRAEQTEGIQEKAGRDEWADYRSCHNSGFDGENWSVPSLICT